MSRLKGSVEQAGAGSWSVVVEARQDPTTGKRKRYVKTVRGNRRTAIREFVSLMTRQPKEG